MKSLIVGIAVCLLAALGANDAWRARQLTQAAGTEQARLDALPLVLGEWRGEPRPFDQKLIHATRAVAYTHRLYTRGGARPAAVNLLILAGSPGDLAAHDPERCYGATGHKSAGNRVRVQFATPGFVHHLWRQEFEREAPPLGRIDVSWGWTTDGHWQAPEQARWEFSGSGMLYKLYASRALPPPSDHPDASDPVAELVTAMAPLFRTAITGTP